jgi:hypothetical protein
MVSESPHNRGPVAEIALAEQRLRGIQNDLVLQTRLMIIAERRLRSILGLPESDNRRLVPTTRPLEDRVSYDWDECQQEILRKHPDLVRVKLEMEPQASRTPTRCRSRRMVLRQRLPRLRCNDPVQSRGRATRFLSLARPHVPHL